MLKIKLAAAATLIGSVSLLALALGGTTPTLAHEHRTVGDHYWIVGFLNEPAYLNQPNGIDLRIYTLPAGIDPDTAKSTDRIGTTGLDQTLQAEVSVGGGAEKLPVELEPRFNDPGAYNGYFIPTAAGDFTFHIFGTVEGTDVDESFTSSPEGFSSVEDTSDLQFPVKIQSPQELATAVTSADSGGDSNTLPIVLAIIGIAVGVLGLSAGGLALSRKS
jgi:hypothetical protein